MIKYIIFSFFLFTNKLWASFNQWEIDPEGSAINEWDLWYHAINLMLIYFRDTIFSLLYVLWIGAFIYIWIKLIMARGKPDEFKKAFTNLIYVIVWILLVSLSWALVRFASWIEFFN